MRDSERAGIRGLTLVLCLGLAGAHAAAGAGNGFRPTRDIRGTTPLNLIVTRTQVLAITSQGFFTRPLDGSTWTWSQDSVYWGGVFPVMPNGDTLLAEYLGSTVPEARLAVSMNTGKSWSPSIVPGPRFYSAG